MASEHSMDICVQFDFQELKNAIEQSKKEALNRFDLKDSNIEIELNDENIKVTTQSEMQIESVYGIIIKKMIGRSLSPKILNRQKIQEVGGMRVRQEMKLIKALDQEYAKNISKKIRDGFPKVKPVIQGDTVRVTSKSIDDLQEVIKALREDESINIPLDFSNFR
jgi:uncharacterized protein YajQ (UPF0234 family)